MHGAQTLLRELCAKLPVGLQSAGYHHILVDEYQDIDARQYALVSAVAGRTAKEGGQKLSIMAVGDDDHNILPSGKRALDSSADSPRLLGPARVLLEPVVAVVMPPAQEGKGGRGQIGQREQRPELLPHVNALMRSRSLEAIRIPTEHDVPDGPVQFHYPAPDYAEDLHAGSAA